ncbi:MAG: hypothetical protein VX589_21230 [Myxococcota bacterium]|nr:hypothetical protein [Myxococcota bacterium]
MRGEIKTAYTKFQERLGQGHRSGPKPTHPQATEQVLADVNLALMAAFLYEDVRGLPYRVRHALMDHFPQPALFNSGHRASWGRAKLSEEQRANLLFNLFCRAMKRANFHYQSNNYGSWFGPCRQPMMKVTNGGRAVEGTVKHFGAPVLIGECSTVSKSFCEVLMAFGFSALRVGTQCVTCQAPQELLALRATEQLVADRANIFGVDLSCPLTSARMYDVRSLAGRERYTANRVEDVKHRYYNTHVLDAVNAHAEKAIPRNDRSLVEVLKRISTCTQNALTNTISTSDCAGMYVTNRSVYQNHYCTFIMPSNGARWQATYFDALYALRTTNGVTTLFEDYHDTGTPVALSDDPLAPRGARVKVYSPRDGSQRRIFEIPDLITDQMSQAFDVAQDRLLTRWRKGETNAESLNIHCPSGLVFDYDNDGHRRNNLNLYEFLMARHQQLYIVWDEDDARSARRRQSGQQHSVVAWLANIVNQFMMYERHMRQPTGNRVTHPTGLNRRTRTGSSASPFRQTHSSRAMQRNPFIGL